MLLTTKEKKKNEKWNNKLLTSNEKGKVEHKGFEQQTKRAKWNTKAFNSERKTQKWNTQVC